jgi:hypothetical protein
MPKNVTPVNISTEIKPDPFTPVPNYIINDPELFMETKLAWIYLFSKRNIPNWITYPNDVQKSCNFGLRGWRRASKQLREYGYLVEIHTQNGSILKFVWEWSKMT